MKPSSHILLRVIRGKKKAMTFTSLGWCLEVKREGLSLQIYCQSHRVAKLRLNRWVFKKALNQEF